jgi:hypothetical protein
LNPIIDIGLRLANVEDMELESEPAETTGDWPAWCWQLSRCRHDTDLREADFIQMRGRSPNWDQMM